MSGEETFPSGYGSTMLTLAKIRLRADVRLLDPEMRRRIFRLMRHAWRLGIPLGIGGAGRSSSAQRAEFMRRHYVDPAGAISFEGRRWSRHSGMLPLAPPGRSYHEEIPPHGALAVDTVPARSWGWQNANCHLFGLRHFGDVNGEPHHLQPVELPTSRSDYNANPAKYPLKKWVFPPLPKGGTR